MTGFHALLSDVRTGDPVAIPDGWKQGRTAYGGLTAALCVAAARLEMRAEVEGLPALRSLQINFTGPVIGDPVFAARLLRAGRNVTSVGVEATVDGGVVAGAQCVFGAARDSELDVDVRAPDCPSPEDADSFFAPGTEGFAPAFLSNFELGLVGGHRPVTGAPEGHVLTWARHRDAAYRDEASRALTGVDGELAFVCLGDVLPPAAFPMTTRLAPISSVNWTLNILRDTTTRDGWYLVETRQTAAREGYSSQVMRYWNTDGRLVAEGMQAVAVFT